MKYKNVKNVEYKTNQLKNVSKTISYVAVWSAFNWNFNNV